MNGRIVVRVEPAEAVVPRGDDVRFTAIVFDELDESLHRAAVVWSSEEPHVVSVAADDTARALVAGSSLVKASFNEVSGSALVTVLSSPDCPLTGKDKRKKHDDDADNDYDDDDCVRDGTRHRTVTVAVDAAASDLAFHGRSKALTAVTFDDDAFWRPCP